MSQLLEKADCKQNAVRACAHCGLPASATEVARKVGAHAAADPSNLELSLEDELVFCCHGCLGAYQLIHSLGLEDYYAMRSNSVSTGLEQSLEDTNRSEILADLDSAGVQVSPLPNGLCSVRLTVDGLHCAACSWLIETNAAYDPWPSECSGSDE